MSCFSALLSCACAANATIASARTSFDFPIFSPPFGLLPALRRALARCSCVRDLPRHIADRLDLETAVEGRPAGLDARPRGQRLAAAEIAAVDAVELLGVALVAQPYDDLEQAIHVRARGLDELLHVVHDQTHLLLEGRVRKRGDRQ